MRPISAPAACIRICRRNWSTTSTTSAIRLPKVLDDIEGLLTDNRIFKQRNVDIGVVTLEECFGMGLFRRHGARLRRRLGSAQVAALRVLSEMDFDIPIGKNGDCYDRYLIRMEEMRQSRADHEAVRRDAELGRKARARYRRSTARSCRRRAAEMKRSMEALIHHFKLYTEGFTCPKARSMPPSRRRRASSASIWSSDGTNKPYRCKIRAPGFAHLQAMDFICRGHMLADVSAVLGSLDIVFGEVDR